MYHEMGFGGADDFLFSLMPFFFVLVFVVILGAILGSVFAGARTWRRNQQSPVLTVEASVVAKRQRIDRYTATWYYATFQVESGDRIELCLEGREYGLLAEGDRGQLTFQGTRYLRFERL